MCFCVLFSATNMYQVPPKCQTQDYVLKIQNWTRHISWSYGGHQVYKQAGDSCFYHSDLLPILLPSETSHGKVLHLQIYFPSSSPARLLTLGALKHCSVKYKTQRIPSLWLEEVECFPLKTSNLNNQERRVWCDKIEWRKEGRVAQPKQFCFKLNSQEMSAGLSARVDE